MLYQNCVLSVLRYLWKLEIKYLLLFILLLIMLGPDLDLYGYICAR